MADPSTLTAVVGVSVAAIYPLVSAYVRRPRVTVRITNGTIEAPAVYFPSGPIHRPQVRKVGGGRVPVIDVEVVTARQAVTIRQWGVKVRGRHGTRDVPGSSLSGGTALQQMRLGTYDAASWRFHVGDLRLSGDEWARGEVRVYVLPAGRSRRAASRSLRLPQSNVSPSNTKHDI